MAPLLTAAIAAGVEPVAAQSAAPPIPAIPAIPAEVPPSGPLAPAQAVARSGAPRIVAVALPAGPAPLQAAADTFDDARTRDLVMRVIRDRRALMIPGSFDLVITHRARVGLEVPDQWLWRDRSLFHSELVGILSWSARDDVGHRGVRRARGSPLLGDDAMAWSGPVTLDPEEDEPFLGLVGLGLDEVASNTLFLLAEGELQVMSARFVDPSGVRGPQVYRYRQVGTIEVNRPAPTTLLGVEAVAREDVGGTVHGVLWFDETSGDLVRMVLRPPGRWPLSAGLRGALRRLPLVEKDARGQVDFLSVQFQTTSQGITVPGRALMEGQIVWLSDLFRMPVALDWRGRWSDQGTTADPGGPDADPIAPGDVRAPRDTAEVVPPGALSDALPPPLSAGWDFGIPQREVNPFLRELARVSVPPPPPTARETAIRALTSFRFNQVQGLSAAVRYPYPVGPRETLTGEVRVSTTSFKATGEASFRRHLLPIWWEVEGYSRLEEANRWEDALGLWNSLEALLFGQDDGNYLRASGASFRVGGENRPLTWQAGPFYEHHSEAPKVTDFSLFGGSDDASDPPTDDVVADEGTVYGLRGRVSFQWGDDPQHRVILLRAASEFAWGDFSYRDVEVNVDVVAPLGPAAGAVRLAVGRAVGDVPAQRLYYLGGRKTVRGFTGNSSRGAAYALIKGEVGTRLPALRGAVFGDVGWAGEPGDIFASEPLASVGVGVSFLDGVLRVDLARGIVGGNDFRVHFYSSGLF